MAEDAGRRASSRSGSRASASGWRACAARASRASRAGAAARTCRPGALGVPVVTQATDYSCGPAALTAQSCATGSGSVAGERELYAPLHTTREGRHRGRSMLEAVARTHGLRAELSPSASRVDELRAALAAGTDRDPRSAGVARRRRTRGPSDWDDGHYVVLVALDGERLYAMDPSPTTASRG